MTNLGWTAERVEELVRRWNETKESCTQIGAAMGVSRNAVIGKIHRLGFAGTRSRPTLSEEEKRRRNAKRQKSYYQATPRFQGKKMEITPEIVPLPPFEGSLDIPFCDLRSYSREGINQCRFIASNFITHDVPACGNETLPGESYCGHCTEMLKPAARTHEERVVSLHMGIRRHQRALRRVA